MTGRLHSSGTLRVTGMTPVEATRVRVDITGFDVVEVDTVAFAGAPEVRFFDAQVPGATGEHRVTFLAADGTELETVSFTVTAPDVAPEDTTAPPPATP